MTERDPEPSRKPWDPVVKLIVIVAVAMVAIQPWISPSLRRRQIAITAPLFLLLLLWSALRRRRDAVGEARRFWTDLAIAVGAWLTGMLLAFSVGPVAFGGAGTVWRLLLDAIFASGLVALVRASERTPYRAQPPRPEAAWPLATVFVFGLYLYFVFLVALEQPVTYADTEPLRLLGAAVGFYLALRFSGLALAAQGRWRIVFCALAANGLLAAIFGTVQLARQAQHLAPALWLGSIITLAIAARGQPGPAAGLARETNPVGRLTATGNSAMIAVLVLPILHFAGYSVFDVLEPELRGARERLVAAWVIGFGAIAWSERRRFYRTIEHQVLGGETLRTKSDSDDDLRVILERRRMDTSLDQSVAKYARAFELCTDAIGIGTLAEGRFIEINPAFEALTGLRRDAIIGHTSNELGLWLHRGDRDALVAAVQRHGGARGIELPLSNRDGGHRLCRFWAQPIEIDGEACIIVIARPVEDAARERLPAPFDDAEVPSLLVDSGGGIRGWNEAANRHLGLADPKPSFDALPDAADRPLPGWPRWESLRDRLRYEGAWSSDRLEALALDPACTRVLVTMRPGTGDQLPR